MSLRDELLGRFPALAGLPPGCWVVGGAVRDLLRGSDPADVDVACPDPLAAAESVGGRVVRLGDQEHLSAWRVVTSEHVYDFAAILDLDIAADLARRDFTINAMGVELASGELLDPHDGRGDLERRVVRMVDPSNFDDDPLRTLKGVRMAVTLGFEIDAATLVAVRLRSPRIREIAAERVGYELSVIFSAGAFRRAVQLLESTGLASPLGFEVRPFDVDDVSLAGAYALLVRDPRAHAKRWRWSDSLRHDVLLLRQLVDRHDRVALYDAGETVARRLPAVLRALGLDSSLDLPDFSQRALLSGDEISSITGLPPGRRVGEIKRALLVAQLLGDVRTRDEAESFVRQA